MTNASQYKTERDEALLALKAQTARAEMYRGLMREGTTVINSLVEQRTALGRDVDSWRSKAKQTGLALRACEQRAENAEGREQGVRDALYEANKTILRQREDNAQLMTDYSAMLQLARERDGIIKAMRRDMDEDDQTINTLHSQKVGLQNRLSCQIHNRRQREADIANQKVQLRGLGGQLIAALVERDRYKRLYFENVSDFNGV